MGTGYTRQSSGAIVNSQVIEASDLNAEFNLLESAFNSATGHSHDGTVGEGPKITLTTSVTGVLPVANGGTNASTKQGAIDSLFDGTTHVDDSSLRIAASADNTKLLRFDTSGITTATTRTWTVPDTNVTITSFAATLLDDADAVAARTTLGVQAYDDDLQALASLSGTGFATRTASNTWAQRDILGTSNEITVTNSNGVSGNPTISLPSSLTFTGKTVSGGTFSGVSITSGSVSGITDLAVADGGTGASTAADARTNLGLGTISTQNANSVSITGGSVSGITDLAVADGGTGASDAATARSNLGANNASNLTTGTIPQARLNLSSLSQDISLSNVDPQIAFTDTTTNTSSRIVIDSGSGDTYFQVGSPGGGVSGNLHLTGYLANDLGSLTARFNNTNATIWHSENDGSGSGLNADYVDGYHASSFLLNTGDTITGVLSTRLGTAFAQARMHEYGWSSGYPGWATYLDASGEFSFYSYNFNTGAYIARPLMMTQSGDMYILGSISKGSGTFLIDHPLDPANRDLAHGFVEAPRYDLIYRGTVALVDGRATVDIDAASNMTDGTFAALTTNAVVTSLQNQDGFARVKPSQITGNSFDIICEDNTCTDTISWVVIAERNDAFVKHMDDNCDTEGRFIPEREKPE